MSEIIDIEEFSKVDMRVGIVKEAIRIPGTKLIRVLVDLGDLGERQIITGIGEYYSPDDLKDKRIIVVVNLKPKRIRGYLSEGMLLAAGCNENSRPYLLTVDGEPKPGSKVC